MVAWPGGDRRHILERRPQKRVCAACPIDPQMSDALSSVAHDPRAAGAGAEADRDPRAPGNDASGHYTAEVGCKEVPEVHPQKYDDGCQVPVLCTS